MEQRRRSSKPTLAEHRERRPLPEFLLLAAVLHLAGLAALDWQPDAGASRRKVDKPARIVALGGTAHKNAKKSAADAIARRLEKEKKKKEEADQREAMPKGQIVEVPPSADDEAPENARYLSEHNTRTERETRSRHQTADYKNATNELMRTQKGKAQGPEHAEARAIEIGPPRPGDAGKKGRQGTDRAFELPNIHERDALALKMDSELGRLANQQGSERLRGNSDRLRLSLGDDLEAPSMPGSAPERGPPTADLVPSVGVLARLNGAPANDALLDLEEGEGTFLNSREFKYATYFNRMKRDVSQHWRPLGEYRRRDPSGNIYGQRSRVTVLQITLNPDGSLKGVEVQRSSGVDFLDNEAVSAFKRAEPFPNPPKGLVDQGGVISFPFGFHIEFNRRGGLPLF